MTEILNNPNLPRQTKQRPRKRLLKAERRAHLLDAAQALFGVLPYDDVSLENISTSAGVSRALIQHYFGNKRELYRQVFARALDQLSERVHIKSEVLNPASTQIRMLDYFEYAVANPAGALVGAGLGNNDDDLSNLVNAFIDRTSQLILDQVPNSKASLPAALFVWSHMNISLTIRIIQVGDIDAQWASAFSTRMLFEAILAPDA